MGVWVRLDESHSDLKVQSSLSVWADVQSPGRDTSGHTCEGFHRSPAKKGGLILKYGLYQNGWDSKLILEIEKRGAELGALTSLSSLTAGAVWTGAEWSAASHCHCHSYSYPHCHLLPQWTDWCEPKPSFSFLSCFGTHSLTATNTAGWPWRIGEN